MTELANGGPMPEMDQNSVCPGCKKSVVDETGGVVVAFGQSFFHVDCFQCAKCGNQVTADTNLLLLSDGSPICSNCSYGCSVCGLPILDEAIMTGDDSYHAHCFKCKVCKNRIDELVFAKTSAGIYCMDCHHQRVARSRQLQKQKEERARQKAAAAAALAAITSQSPESSSSRERAPSRTRDQDRVSEAGTSARDSSPRPQERSTRYPAKPPSRDGTLPPTSTPLANKRRSVMPLHDMLHGQRRPSSSEGSPQSGPSSPSQGIPSRTGSANGKGRALPPPPEPSINLPDDNNSIIANYMDQDPPDKQGLNPPLSPNGDRRKSFDDGMRPLNVLLNRATGQSARSNSLDTMASSTNGTSGLQIPDKPSSRRDKRQSINPSMLLGGMMAGGTGLQSPPSLTSPPTQQSRSGTPLGTPSGHRDSPLREYFPDQPSPRNSNGTSTPYHAANHALSDQSRARTASASAVPDTSLRERPPIRQSNTLERVPPRNTSLTGAAALRMSNEAPKAPAVHRISSEGMTSGGRLSPIAPSPIRTQRSFDRRPSTADGRLSPNAEVDSRSTSPMSLKSRTSNRSPARQDVPQGVDSESESEGGAQSEEGLPPAPPPKEIERMPTPLRVDTSMANTSTAADASFVSTSSTSSGESSPVERMSHATFIAPALPPIRFSMSGADFGDILRNVGGGSANGKIAEQLSRLAEEQQPHSPADSSFPNTPQTSAETRTPTAATLRDIPEGGVQDMFTQPWGQGKGRPLSSSSLNGLVGGSIEVDKTPTKRTRGSSHSELASPAVESRTRSWSESQPPSSYKADSVNGTTSSAGLSRYADPADIMTNRLRDVVNDCRAQGSQHVKLEFGFLEAILGVIVQRENEYAQLKGRLEGMKRASQQYVTGMSVAQTEYDRELKARRDAEAEVSRLRVLLSGQAARLSVMSSATKKQAVQEQLSQELTTSLSTLGQDVSKLRVERDMTLAEMEELSASKSSPDPSSGLHATRSLSMRLDNIKGQYQRDLGQLSEEREALAREIAELKASREVYLEETTALNARNEELAKLSASYARRVEEALAARDDASMRDNSGSFDRQRVAMPSMTDSVTTLAATDESADQRWAKSQRSETPESTPQPKGIFWKRPGPKTKHDIRQDTVVINLAPTEKELPKGPRHAFQQTNVLRIARCDHCGDKGWGSIYRCTNCNLSVHTRCVNRVSSACFQSYANQPDETMSLEPLPPSMFGRDLIEQAQADADRENSDRMVPVIVDKCINAVEMLAMDYEGIYRKTGGSSQSKMITQLFERGDYDAIDLYDTDKFNDICSVTSVLKNYFRALPDPLMSYDLHEEFMQIAPMKDKEAKMEAIIDVVTRLPAEHYHTLKALMVHLHRVRQLSDTNLMGSRNLGVVFGPTLMRSRDPSKEFSDMAGKAITVEWLVEYAPQVFQD